jgi:sugar/nucleoside kinase (ribokinase family)
MIVWEAGRRAGGGGRGRPRVLVVGDVIEDVVVTPAVTPEPGADVPATIQRRPGGSAANQSAWLGHLGARVMFVGRAGARDVAFHGGELAKYGVEARIAADELLQTGRIVVLVEPDGERTMITDRGANARLTTTDLPAEFNVDLVLLSGYLFAEPGPRAAAFSLIASGARFAVDPASYSMLAVIGPERFLEWTEGAAACFPNRDEGRLLTGESDPEAMADRLRSWYELVVLKLGEDGAIVAGRGFLPAHVPAVPVRAVDSTGAGDAFCAAFVAAWLGGEEPVAAARVAATLAATTVTAASSRPTA